MTMVIVTTAINVVSFADVFVSWLLFDSIRHSNHQPVAPSVSIINNSVAPPRTITTSRGTAEHIWTLPNGRVQFDCPLSFAGLSMRNGEITRDPIFLSDPKLLGRCDKK